MKRFLMRAKTEATVGLLCLCGLVMLVAPVYAESFHFTMTSDQRADANTVAITGRVLQSINDILGGPGVFHVSVGDIDYGTSPTNRQLIDTYFGTNFLWYGVVGNHDAESPTTDMVWLRNEYSNGNNLRAPLKNFTLQNGPTGSVETTYSWNYGNAHFVVLNEFWNGKTNANSDCATNGDIGQPLRDWLAADLATTDKPFIFVFMHQPAFPYNHHYGDSIDRNTNNRNAFWSLLESKGVTAVFSGHTHYQSKHQGDVRGHTYDYPAINSWRTQDPNVAGLYGQVWQIDTGNAGQMPGGITAGPTNTDYLPTSLQWNGVTFIDVVVDEGEARINIYQDLSTNSYSLGSTLGTNFNLLDTVLVLPAPVISGYVLDSNNTPIEGVALSADNNGNSATTDANGYYQIRVPGGWSGTVTPTKPEYTFDPNVASYTNVVDNIPEQNYAAIFTPDLTPPSPDPMTWASPPAAAGRTSITMTATTAEDASPPVMYYFECINDGAVSSAWQANPTYVASGLSPGAEYTFRVKARDSAATLNETAWSTESAVILPPAVDLLGSWVAGTNHPQEAGLNRALVFIAHAERSNSFTLNSVTYGYQPMTKVVETNNSSGTTRTYVAAFVLNDVNIAAATDNAFRPSWSATPSGSAYASTFLQSVNQSALTGATARSATSTGSTISTAALANSDGDMVIEAATCSNTGTYTVTNGFTKALEPSIANAAAVEGYKSATGTNETPKVVHSTTTGRQSLIGFVVKIVPVQATAPQPPNLAINVSLTPSLSWTPGVDATSHDVYFGTNPSPGANEFQGNQPDAVFTPGTLNAATTYYWRIDERSAGRTTTGDVWSFTTVPLPPGQAINPTPADGATNVGVTTDLSWTAGTGAASHNVYFGTANPPAYKTNQTSTTYDTGTMIGNTTYYWRIDETNAGGTTLGTIWSFTTAAGPPTFVATGAVASNTVAITPALPAGIATGDILLLFLETANQAISIANQNGGTWTAVTNSPPGTGTAGSTSATRLTVFWSRYNGTQGAPTTSDSGDHQLGRMIAIRGAAASGNPWNVTAGGVEAVSDTSGSIPGATTTVANTLVVAAIATALPDATGTSNFSSWANSNLTGITERTDNTTSQGNGGGLGIVTGTKATAGAYGNTSVTCASSSYKAMMSIAIKP